MLSINKSIKGYNFWLRRLIDKVNLILIVYRTYELR